MTKILMDKGVSHAHLAVYWMLHYVLTLMVVKMDSIELQRVVMLSMFTMIQVYQDVMARNRSDKRIKDNNRAGVENLYAFKPEFMQHYIVYCAKLLHLLYQHRKLSLYALSSYPCENLFSQLRV